MIMVNTLHALHHGSIMQNIILFSQVKIESLVFYFDYLVI